MTNRRKLTEVATVLGYAAQQSADLFTGFRLYGEKEDYATAPSKQIYHIEQYTAKTLFDTSPTYIRHLITAILP